MKNTFAIGIPDKVGRAERDRKSKETKAIEFDLPKGYSAEDAFYSGLNHLNVPKSEYKHNWRYIRHKYIEPLCCPKNEWWHMCSKQDRANFYLLLAAANGHKLE